MACSQNIPFFFKHPFSMLIAGPTTCGKSTFMKDLLSHPQFIKPQPKQILWCYGTDDNSDNLDQFKGIIQSSKLPIRFHKGIPDVNNITSDDHMFIVLDDLMQKAGKSNEITKLFTLGMHHKNISVALIVQNVFYQAAAMRNISLNCHYFVLFKNPRDGRQIKYLSNQIFPNNPKYLTDAFQKATERPFGYLIIDLTQQTPDNLRVLTNLFPDQFCHFFIPLEGCAC